VRVHDAGHADRHTEETPRRRANLSHPSVDALAKLRRHGFERPVDRDLRPAEALLRGIDEDDRATLGRSEIPIA
jgi:hypothetical protein